MNNNDISNDSLLALKKGINTLKDSLPADGLICDREIRKAMQSKSSWLSKVMITELITLPICTLALFGVSHAIGMSIWPMVTFAFFAALDTIFDFRTFKIPQKWILNDSLIELSKKLYQQKKERMRQTIVSTSLLVPWVIWFVYEWLRHDPLMDTNSNEEFMITWGITSGIWLIIAFIIIRAIYKKAQRTNDEMIRQLGTADEPK